MNSVWKAIVGVSKTLFSVVVFVWSHSYSFTSWILTKFWVRKAAQRSLTDQRMPLILESDPKSVRGPLKGTGTKTIEASYVKNNETMSNVTFGDLKAWLTVSNTNFISQLEEKITSVIRPCGHCGLADLVNVIRDLEKTKSRVEKLETDLKDYKEAWVKIFKMQPKEMLDDCEADFHSLETRVDEIDTGCQAVMKKNGRTNSELSQLRSMIAEIRHNMMELLDTQDYVKSQYRRTNKMINDYIPDHTPRNLSYYKDDDMFESLADRRKSKSLQNGDGPDEKRLPAVPFDERDEDLAKSNGSIEEDFSKRNGSFNGDFSKQNGSFNEDFSKRNGSFNADNSKRNGSFNGDLSKQNGSLDGSLSAKMELDNDAQIALEETSTVALGDAQSDVSRVADHDEGSLQSEESGKANDLMSNHVGEEDEEQIARKEKELAMLEMRKLEEEEMELVRIAQERVEKERLELEEKERIKAEEAELARLEREEEELARMEREEAEIAKMEAEEAELQRIEAEEAELARMEAEDAELAKLEAEEREFARIEAEKAKIEAEEAELARMEAENAALAKLEAEEAELAKLEEDQAELLRIEEEEKELARIEAEEKEMARIEAEEKELARMEAEEAELAKIEAEEAKLAKMDAEEAELAKLEAEEAELAKIEAEEAELARLEAEEAAELAKKKEQEENAKKKKDEEKPAPKTKTSGKTPGKLNMNKFQVGGNNKAKFQFR